LVRDEFLEGNEDRFSADAELVGEFSGGGEAGSGCEEACID
jgi:hypothetical protein